MYNTPQLTLEPAMLMGDEYGLWTPGTGNPVVKLI